MVEHELSSHWHDPNPSSSDRHSIEKDRRPRDPDDGRDRSEKLMRAIGSSRTSMRGLDLREILGGDAPAQVIPLGELRLTQSFVTIHEMYHTTSVDGMVQETRTHIINILTITTFLSRIKRPTALISERDPVIVLPKRPPAIARVMLQKPKSNSASLPKNVSMIRSSPPSASAFAPMQRAA